MESITTKNIAVSKQSIPTTSYFGKTIACLIFTMQARSLLHLQPYEKGRKKGANTIKYLQVSKLNITICANSMLQFSCIYLKLAIYKTIYSPQYSVHTKSEPFQSGRRPPGLVSGSFKMVHLCSYSDSGMGNLWKVLG